MSTKQAITGINGDMEKMGFLCSTSEKTNSAAAYEKLK